MCTILVENGYDFDELRRSMTDVGIAFWREQLGPAPTADLEEKRGLVLKQTVREGRGPVLPASAFVRYHYSAWLERSPLPFDSTVLRSRNRPPAIRFSPDNGSSIYDNYLCTTTSNALLLAIALAFFRWPSYSNALHALCRDAAARGPPGGPALDARRGARARPARAGGRVRASGQPAARPSRRARSLHRRAHRLLHRRRARRAPPRRRRIPLFPHLLLPLISHNKCNELMTFVTNTVFYCTFKSIGALRTFVLAIFFRKTWNAFHSKTPSLHFVKPKRHANFYCN